MDSGDVCGFFGVVSGCVEAGGWELGGYGGVSEPRVVGG